MRLRRKRDDPGKTLTAAEAAFLADYDKPTPVASRDVSPRNTTARDVSPRDVSPRDVAPTVIALETGVTHPPAPLRRWEPRGEEPAAEVATGEADEDPDDEEDTASPCTVEDCACRTLVDGARVCPVLDRRVYPPLEQRGAELLASFGLGVVGLVAATGVFLYCRFGQRRRDVPGVFAMLTPPRQEDIQALGADVMVIQRRHFNRLGAGGDWLGALRTLGGYGLYAAGGAAETAGPAPPVAPVRESTGVPPTTPERFDSAPRSAETPPSPSPQQSPPLRSVRSADDGTVEPLVGSTA